MIATPLGMIFKGKGFPLWPKENRRYFGVTAFGYAALHLVFCVLAKGSLAKILGEITHLDIWTGWLVFLIALPLTATSFDAADPAGSLPCLLLVYLTEGKAGLQSSTAHPP